MSATALVNELYLSEVLDRTVINDQGHEVGRLWDMIMIPGEVFPEVSHLLVKDRKQLYSIPWQGITLFTPFVISASAPLGEIIKGKYTPSEADILVKRDILDKQIVDVDGAKVVRVNDLKLGNRKDLLCIFTVDIGFRGLLRRLGHERLWEQAARLLRKEIRHQEISWEYVQPLETNASRLTLTMARDQMADMHPADIASIISQLSHTHIQTVLTSLDTETAGEAIHELEPELRSRVMSQLDSEQASDILEEMAPDEAADVLGDLPEEKAKELLELMDEEEAEDIQELLEHEEDSAGGLMNSEYIAIGEALTVDEALAEIRRLAPETETVYYAYVIDREERLQGVVSLKELLLNEGNMPIAEIMTTNLKTVDVEATPEDILEIVAKYNLVAVPVLDEEEKMAGIVTVDDILELFLPFALRRRRYHH
ncbi:membrane protein [Geotalea uraniireducens]|uniref:Membrane protein n=1 Tax=Geotalea uraniireducens TaxID=351604 RepID=A0ABN6VTB3_9BACT|nr:CBS domain-containing protein [Geotalea uraniireducens]BDV43546.1 membrane protein [Geotalea uraniireducens]